MIIGRFIAGINVGVGCAVAPVYLNEIAPAKKKGLCGVMFPLGVNVGVISAQLAGLIDVYGNFEHWEMVFLFGCFPICVQIILIFFSPETPDWLKSQGKFEDAQKVQTILYGDFESLEEMKLRLKSGGVNSELENGFWQNIQILFRDINITRAVLTGLSLHIIQQMCGANAIGFYKVVWQKCHKNCTVSDFRKKP